MCDTADKIKVMQAFLDGKKIEYRWKTVDSPWLPVYSAVPQWDWAQKEYRIVPEKVTVHIYKDKHGYYAGVNIKIGENKLVKTIEVEL